MAKLLMGALAGGLVLTFLIEVVLLDHQGKFWWSNLTGWEIWFGFIGCLVLIFGAKALGKHLVSRPDDYYDR